MMTALLIIGGGTLCGVLAYHYMEYRRSVRQARRKGVYW